MSTFTDFLVNMTGGTSNYTGRNKKESAALTNKFDTDPNKNYAGVGSAWRQKSTGTPNGRWDANGKVVNSSGIPNGPGPGGTWPGGATVAPGSGSGLGFGANGDSAWKNVGRGQVTAKPQAELDDYTNYSSPLESKSTKSVTQTAPITTMKKKTPAGKKTVRKAVKRVKNASRGKAKPRTQMVQMARTTSGNPFAKNFGGWGQLFQGDKTTKSGKPITLSKYNEKRSAAGMEPMRQEAINRLKKGQGIGRRKKANTSDPLSLF